MASIPEEVWIELILIHSDIWSIVSLSKTCKKLQKICKLDKVWNKSWRKITGQTTLNRNSIISLMTTLPDFYKDERQTLPFRKVGFRYTLKWKSIDEFEFAAKEPLRVSEIVGKYKKNDNKLIKSSTFCLPSTIELNTLRFDSFDYYAYEDYTPSTENNFERKWIAKLSVVNDKVVVKIEGDFEGLGFKVPVFLVQSDVYADEIGF